MKCENCGASCHTHICPYCNSRQVNPAAEEKRVENDKIEQELARLEDKISFLQNSYGHAPKDMLDKKIKIVEKEIASIKNSKNLNK